MKKYHWYNLEKFTTVGAFNYGRILTLEVSFTSFVDKKNYEFADDTNTQIYFELRSRSSSMTVIIGELIQAFDS